MTSLIIKCAIHILRQSTAYCNHVLAMCIIRVMKVTISNTFISNTRNLRLHCALCCITEIAFTINNFFDPGLNERGL
jgi:hypothetical protein